MAYSSEIPIHISVVVPTRWMAAFDTGAIDRMAKPTSRNHDLPLYHLYSLTPATLT